MNLTVKCPYCGTKNETSLEDLLYGQYMDCQGCLEVFEIEIRLKGRKVGSD